MNVLEKAEKSLEFLVNPDNSNKCHELQAAVGTLGRCLGALGCRPNHARHFANLLHSAIPTLLALASHDSAEVRLVGDEALNRAVVGGFSYHAHKTNIVLMSHVDPSKNARWVRAALSRVCLGDSWLRPGAGRARAQAQTLFPRLAQIVRTTRDTQLIVEALESNLPRVLDGLAEFTTDEEITELTKALLPLMESAEPAARRGAAACVGAVCARRAAAVPPLLAAVCENLWPFPAEYTAAVGWLGLLKSIFQQTDVASGDSELISVADFMELYTLCIAYLESAESTHNVHNAAMECLSAMLSRAEGRYRKALLDRHPRPVDLDSRSPRGHSRNISSVSAITSVISSLQLEEPSANEPTELLSFSGALHLGSLSQLTTPQLSVEDLTTIQTPDSPTSETEMPEDDPSKSEQLSKDLAEKLEDIGAESDSVDHPTVYTSTNFKINIGTAADDDIPLKYCARLLVSKFLLTGNKGDIHSDRAVRVSVKASALGCMAELLRLYPQAIAAHLDRDRDAKGHNVSGSSEDSTQDQLINDFILERNVCYQESLTDSLCQEYLNKGLESSQTISKRDLEISEKSTKDIPSNIMDSHSTNVNMTISNFTTNSNMSNSNDRISSGYPMSSSGELLSTSLDLDMKFDHFGEAAEEMQMKPRREKRKVETEKREAIVEATVVESKEFVCQHMSEMFSLLEGHCDPQIRGLVRVCIGSYLEASLDLSHGDYTRWRPVSSLPQGVGDEIAVDKLVEVVLKGLTDSIHTCVTHTLNALSRIAAALSNSCHRSLVPAILNGLVAVEGNGYWLCRVNLCKLYERLPYERIFIVCPDYRRRGARIMAALCRLLADQDQKVRRAAGNTIASIIPKIYPSRSLTPSTMLIEQARKHSELFNFKCTSLALDLVRDNNFYHDLPEQLKMEQKTDCHESLRLTVGDLMGKLMESSCKFYWQGLLETLQTVAKTWTPWNYKSAYTGQGILDYCVDNLDCCNSSVVAKTIMLDLCRLVYPVEIDSTFSAPPSGASPHSVDADIFERAPADRWRHLRHSKMAAACERLQLTVLRLLNVVVHLVEEVSPNAQASKILPGSPVRRNVSDSRRNSNDQDDKGVLKKKNLTIGNLRAHFAGNFYGEPFYMKFYDHLRAAYSNHKINLDPKSSIFHEFLSTLLDALAIQLELSTEKEFGNVSEELLYYLRVIMPLNQEKSIYCITQLLKCLFGTNMINQYQDFQSVKTKRERKQTKPKFYEDVLLVNGIDTLATEAKDSASSNVKLSLDVKNPSMMVERNYLINLENFARNRTDRKWSTNKKELERYIRLFEPVVIQSLKSYTMLSCPRLQCSVLRLLGQLLTLRVNYCMLDSELVFIGYLHRQLDLVEQSEIPNPCELVSNIMLFLVQLFSSKHHSKQIIDVPKLIQLCDSLLAAGFARLCARSLACLAPRVFSNQGATCSRSQTQQTCAHREVLFSMMLKTLNCRETITTIRAVLALSHDQPESYIRWSQLAADALLTALANRDVQLDAAEDVAALEALIDAIYRDELVEQSRVEAVLKIMFKPPVDQSCPLKEKTTYLAILLILLRKFLPLVPENEILLTVNYLKTTLISPQSIFFHAKPDIDPLNVSRNENCAHLPPDVVLVRLLFKTLTLAVIEVDSCHEFDSAGAEAEAGAEAAGCRRFLYSVCVGLVCHVKHMLHLTDGCAYPLTSKTAQTLLANELSGLNTGLYSPDENVPVELLNLVCLRAAHRTPLLTVHWSHMIVRLNLLEQKCCQKLLGCYNAPVSARSRDSAPSPARDALLAGVALALCEHFLSNGIQSAVQLSWLVVSRIQTLVANAAETPVASLLGPLHEEAACSMLLLRAVAARGQEDQYTMNTFKVLSGCHESQSGALILLICRALPRLEPALANKFVKLAIARCETLKALSYDEIQAQLSKEDIQAAFELLQRDKAHLRYHTLVAHLSALAAAAFDQSPLDARSERAVSAQYVAATSADRAWLLKLVGERCCQAVTGSKPSPEKMHDLALQLSKLTYDELTTTFNCQEFDRRIIGPCFKVSCHSYLREFISIIAVYESKETEKDRLIEQREEESFKDTQVDSNKLSNTLQVFKKSDNKECKSQFFIPITDSNEKVGSLQLSEEPNEIVPPKLPDLYLTAVSAFEKSLTDVIRSFPKQSRPLSQSENFNLNIEHSLDRYTWRCHQVFQDKLFYQEFCTLHTILRGFLTSLESILDYFNEIDCDVLEKCQDDILPTSLAKNIAIFTVISLQYLSFLIKNKAIVESPVNAEVTFRSEASCEKVVIDKVIEMTLNNLSKALDFKDIWRELNADKNTNRLLSAISCFYAVVKYLVKDTKPIRLKSCIRTRDDGPKCDTLLVCNKLATLVEYWEETVYKKEHFVDNGIIGDGNRRCIERLIVALSRLHLVSNVPLIPPMAWPDVEVVCNKDDAFKVDLPLQALQDADVLQSFLFRINLISWSSKKQFEEIWVALLNGLQGSGCHWSVRGITQSLASAAGGHVPRRYPRALTRMSRMKQILLGTEAYAQQSACVNLERTARARDGCGHYQHGQFSPDYLKLAADITDYAPFKVRQQLKRMRKLQEIDINSCVQLVIDVATQMLHPKAPTGLAARAALLDALCAACELAPDAGSWCALAQQVCAEAEAGAPAHRAPSILRALSLCLALLYGFEGLTQELSTVHQKLMRSITSNSALLRQAAVQGCLLQMYSPPKLRVRPERGAPGNTYLELVGKLNDAVRRHLAASNKISLYEQSLHWTVLFALVELGHADLMHLAVNLLLERPRHYCADLVVKGITSMIRQQVLPKDLKKTIIEKLMDNMNRYSERHVIQIVMVHLFTADDRLLSPRLAADVSNMDPDILMTSMERVALLYRVLRAAAAPDTRRVAAAALQYFLRETLPPAATLSRVVIEHVESVKATERAACGALGERARWRDYSLHAAEIVFEVFETAVSQDQLPVLSGWIFEALCHLLSGKISQTFLPYCLNFLLVSASFNPCIRLIEPLAHQILRTGYENSAKSTPGKIFLEKNEEKISYSDRKLLCIVAMHSNFTEGQLDRLRELCEGNDALTDLNKCLVRIKEE